MRTLAASLDVQASSLYRYFQHREELEGLVAERAAALLEERMRKASRATGPAGAFRAAANEYVRFARAEPELFEFLVVASTDDQPRPAGKSLWDFILAVVARVSGKADDTAAAVAVWSLLHGFAVLERSGAFGASGPKRGFDVGVEAMLKGLAKL
jgi:AcrR family transcriptional regulator